MSKSNPADLSQINLLDSPELIQQKIKKCKTDPERGLTAAMITHLDPIQAKYAEVVADRAYLEGVLRDGHTQAEAIADRTLAAVKAALGFSQPL
jgi:tryptophanyl-tRNA synthetase